jgi:predicted outer membrane repeat protein
MSKIGFGQLRLIGLVAALLAGATASAYGAYAYEDSFSTDKAQDDSLIHARFWLDRATPPAGPYLYYLESGWNRQLVLMGYQNQMAQFGYRFAPNSTTPQAVSGWLSVEVSFPSTATISQVSPGQLSYSVSGDGLAWSVEQPLSVGRHQIPLDAPTGAAYVRFSGTQVAIDNLQVSLSSPTATLSVPGTYSTIQAAINAARNGDIIEVGPGTYSNSGNQDIEFHGKAVTLRSSAGPLRTIINVGAGHRGFLFRGGEGADTVLSGFTIQNAQVSSGRGAGIYCEFSSPTITNCIIQNCTAVVGGGIGGWGAAPTITDCTITGCSASYGGAIGLIQQSNAIVTRCEIKGNSASVQGGGIYCSDSLALVGGCRITGNSVPTNMPGGGAYCAGASTDATFKNCVIAANSAGIGGGLYTESTAGLQRCAVTITNCTVANNQVPYPQVSGVYSAYSDIFVTNSILWGNGFNPLSISFPLRMNPVTYSDVEGGYYEGEGNFSQDPLFVNVWAGDYHLQSTYGQFDAQRGWVSGSLNSPCIDAGDRGVSVASEPFANGGRVNLGAYGASEEASKSREHTIFHVDINGGRDWNSGRSQTQAFRTIGEALDAAQSGDTILVWPGVYREELVFGGKAVTLQSAADAAVLEAQNDYAISFYHAEGPTSIVSNFVIRGCLMGAIFCDGASPTLKNLTVVNNAVGVWMGFGGGEPYVTNCIFWGNGGNLYQVEAHFSYVQGEADPRLGNISGDPQFADSANGDFHLKSAYGRYVPTFDTWTTDPVTSPCIDRGNPEDYYEAEIEPNGDIINMGAYGGTPYASKSSY